MSFLPDVVDGELRAVSDESVVKMGARKKRRNTKKKASGKKLWREYYESIEFIKHL